MKLGKEKNEEEDIVFEAKAVLWRLPVRSDDSEKEETYSGGWAKSAAGSLKLYRHKETEKTRLVQRNHAGQVKLNLSIGEGVTELEKVVTSQKKKGRKAKQVAYVKFVAVADEDVGLEFFLLKVKPDKVDMLYYVLKGMGAGVKGEKGIDP